ncbi:MAG: hypothetical protein ACREBS_00410 [Nitrososphaerales archaeon]
MLESPQKQQKRERYGAWILVYPRDNGSTYQNHYIAKVKITSDGFHRAKEHYNIAMRAFGLASLIEGFNSLEEGMFFTGRLISAWISLKSTKDLDPQKHVIKVKGAEGYAFPKKYLEWGKLKQYIEPFEVLEESPEEPS